MHAFPPFFKRGAVRRSASCALKLAERGRKARGRIAKAEGIFRTSQRLIQCLKKVLQQ